MNKLEALVLPVTSKEIDNGSFERIIKQLEKIDTTDLCFVIMINNIEHKSDIMTYVSRVESKFKTVEVVYANITPEDDIYMNDNTVSLIIVPEYGRASGPNLLFFSCMEYCKKFNTVFLIETDCTFKKTFLKDLEMFTRYSGGFLIAGTTYDGTGFIRSTSPDFHHINGVALYKTCDPTFHHVIEELHKYITENVKTSDEFLAYDVAFARMVFRNMNFEKSDDWKRVFKRFIKTNLIVNLSPVKDASTKDIIMRFPEAVVIHKKFKDTDVHSLPGFLVQDLDL